MSSWIKMLSDELADDELVQALSEARTPHGTVDNVLRVHSLRPSTMKGHMALYKSCLHDKNNTLPEWLQETISSYVSILNSCEYSLLNHWKNAEFLIGDDKRSDQIYISLKNRKPQDCFTGVELALMQYAEKLTLKPSEMKKDDVDNLRTAGLDDGQILEANQIICYFNYVNRSINGLGVTNEGDIIGYYKDD